MTNSFDGTSDTLVRLCRDRGIEVFRWNMDMWRCYETSVDSEGYFLSDQFGREIRSSDPELVAVWRKPFVQVANQTVDDSIESFAREQLRVYLRSLSQNLAKNGKLRLVNPFLEMNFSKLLQLKCAEEFFTIPDWEFRTLNYPLNDNEMVVKPIGYPMLTNGRTVFTNILSPLDLEHPFPWLFQKPIIAGVDVTCVFIGGICHWYESSFERKHGAIDWRKEIQTENESSWLEIPEDSVLNLSINVRSFMSASGLKYGRLDFIRDEQDIFWFLECNVNGEFGWLDDVEEKLHLLYLDAIFKEHNSIPGLI